MFKKIAKWCAKFALGYLDKVAVWALKMGTEKTKDSDRAQAVLAVVKQLSADANAIAKAMEDGTITDEEAKAVEIRVKALAEDLKELL